MSNQARTRAVALARARTARSTWRRSSAQVGARQVATARAAPAPPVAAAREQRLGEAALQMVKRSPHAAGGVASSRRSWSAQAVAHHELDVGQLRAAARHAPRRSSADVPPRITNSVLREEPVERRGRRRRRRRAGRRRDRRRRCGLARRGAPRAARTVDEQLLEAQIEGQQGARRQRREDPRQAQGGAPWRVEQHHVAQLEAGHPAARAHVDARRCCTGTPSTSLARASIGGRHCSMRGRMHQCSVSQASSSRLQAATAAPTAMRHSQRTQRVACGGRRGRRPGGDDGHGGQGRRRWASRAAVGRLRRRRERAGCHGCGHVWRQRGVASRANLAQASMLAVRRQRARPEPARSAAPAAARPSTAASCSACAGATRPSWRCCLPGLPDADDRSTALVERLQPDGRDLPAALRVARQLVLERLAVLDVEAGAPLAGRHRRHDRAGRSHARASRWPRPAPSWTRATARRATRAASASTSGSSAWASSARASSTSRRDIDLIYVYEEDGTDRRRATR